MTQKTALFPGSFDPFTSGHEAIVQRALALFDHIVVAVGVNTDKKYMFTSQQRMQKIRDSFPNDSRVEVVEYSDMTVDLCKRVGAHFILRGIRNTKDLEYEQTIAAVNKALAPDIETVLLLADDKHRDISSTLIREQLAHQQKETD
ncbi:MAG: pantetheine-phosphate adenylyltransferase [Bacteroidales bacterium]|nr:pantetheine-phosphate adenylyltransferase [Bacteroidales bacterium]